MLNLKKKKKRDWTEGVNIVIISRSLVEHEIVAVRIQNTGKTMFLFNAID